MGGSTLGGGCSKHVSPLHALQERATCPLPMYLFGHMPATCAHVGLLQVQHLQKSSPGFLRFQPEQMAHGIARFADLHTGKIRGKAATSSHVSGVDTALQGEETGCGDAFKPDSAHGISAR